ncbi:DUF1015 domain-containing protein [Nocardiopsis coralliicola]
MGGGALELAPLRGLRYADSDPGPLLERSAFDLGLALSPPYDLVRADDYARMMREEPHNAARLTAPPDAEPAPAGAGSGRYARAAATLRRWMASGVLVRDAEPALYLYEQTTAGGLRQRGLIGALRLPGGGQDSVQPHEAIAEGPVVDRARLMEAARANLEPILLLYRGSTDGVRGAASRAAEPPADAPPLAATTTGDGTRHRLWALRDPALHAAVAADLADRSALIADGHHRYAAYRMLQQRSGSPGPWDHGLALLVDSETSPPRLGAIHRVVRGASARTAARAAARVAPVEELPSAGAPVPDGRIILDDGHDRFALGPVDAAALAAASPGHSAEWRALPTAALERVLLPLWGAVGPDVELVHDDPAAAVAAACSTPGGATAVLLPPVSVEQVYRVSAHGELTPRKSTSFGPKPRTGLVMRTFDPNTPLTEDR